MKTWFAVDIIVDPHAADAVESALNMLDPLGTEIDSLRKAKDEPQVVTGFFEALPADEDIKTAIDESLSIYGFDAAVLKSVASRAVEETDWLAEWKRHWKPTVSGTFVIAPPWADVRERDKIVIRIEPNMAFGTGTHETTRLCLRAITDAYHAHQTFLDVGTGTGILAIAAAKLGGKNIVAFDTDADSVKIARENAVANGVADRIEFFDGTLTDALPKFDFVCANLTLDVIIPLLPILMASAGETLVLSGILTEQKDHIDAELRNFESTNFRFETAGEWLAVIISKV